MKGIKPNDEEWGGKRGRGGGRKKGNRKGTQVSILFDKNTLQP